MRKMAGAKECVACTEEILVAAKLCKHCGTTQDDPRFTFQESQTNQNGAAGNFEASPSRSGIWQFLPSAEQRRRIQIMEYVVGSGQDFFYRYDAYEYLFTVGKMNAQEAQIARMESIGETWDDGPDLARSPALTARESEQFANANVAGVRMNLSRNLLTPPAILAKLSNDSDINVRIGVAANPSSPLDSLSQLMGEVGLQTHVFGNLALTPDFISDGLQNSALGNLRFFLLGNWNVDSTDIAYYWGNADKKRLLVAEQLSKNALLPTQFFEPILDYLADELSEGGLSSKKFEQVFEALANLVGNPGLPDKLFKKIKTDVPGVFSEFGHLALRPRVAW
jgi:hypothetical protein